MRRLLWIPVVHDPADMGSTAMALLRESIRLAGPDRWRAHQEVMEVYWRRIEERLARYRPPELAVYQDGLPVAGELGLRIVAEAAERGSRNHGIVMRLVEGGAQLRRTEDAELLQQERAQVEGDGGRLSKARLLAERDRAIARNIDGSLGSQEIGVLFIGAGHRVGELLPPDVAVEMVKDPRAVQAYFQVLFIPAETDAFTALAGYLKQEIA